MKEALYWREGDNGSVVCELCPHGCRILPGRVGICGVRQNVDGILYSQNYAMVTSLALDPVEKKPLYHFEPGGLLLSVGSFGCNFKCEFCQNWEISQGRPESRSMEPADVIGAALRARDRFPQTVGIAYTYNEPTVWYEFVLECAREARKHNLRNVLVSNGYISQESLEELIPSIDALNIDVKAWTQSFYSRLVHGRLENVLDTVRRSKKSAWVEVTYLVIPGENDEPAEVEELSGFLAQIDRNIPLHLSRYFPAYRFHKPPTPIKVLEQLRGAAMKRLNYVYVGNVMHEGWSDTYCPSCGTVLLKRGGLALEEAHIVDGKCPGCGRPVDVVGNVWDASSTRTV